MSVEQNSEKNTVTVVIVALLVPELPEIGGGESEDEMIRYYLKLKHPYLTPPGEPLIVPARKTEVLPVGDVPIGRIVWRTCSTCGKPVNECDHMMKWEKSGE